MLGFTSAVFPRMGSRPPGSKLLVIILGAALGASAGSLPYVATGPLVEQSTEFVAAPMRARALGPAFEDEVIKTLSKTPEGREVLDRLRDRGGVIRLPAFVLARLTAGGITMPLINTVFLDPVKYELPNENWTFDDIKADPEKQRALARVLDSSVLHELHHAALFRAWLTPGQIASGRPIGGLLSLEMEHEAHFATQHYLDAKLREGLPMTKPQLQAHEEYLNDFDAFVKSIDGSGTYAAFSRTDPARDAALLAAERKAWRELRHDSYERLAQRHVESSNYYKAYTLREKARAIRAAEVRPGA